MVHLILAHALLSSQTARLEEKSPMEFLLPQSLVHVLDNSASMADEAGQLDMNLEELWNGFSAPEIGDTASGGGRFADVAIGVTMVAVEGSQPGSAGSLIQPAINAQQGAAARLQLQRDILCSAPFWDSSNPIVHDENYEWDESETSSAKTTAAATARPPRSLSISQISQISQISHHC